MYVCIIHDIFRSVNNSNYYYFYFAYFKFSNIWLKCYEKDWFYTISENLAVHCSFSFAKKYGVDFAVVRDREKSPPVYTVFFKAKDTDAVTRILQDYSAKQIKKPSVAKTSVLEKLKKFKEIVAAIPKKVAEKKKERSLWIQNSWKSCWSWTFPKELWYCIDSLTNRNWPSWKRRMLVARKTRRWK